MFTLINAERTETSEEVPLMQATHLSEVSLDAAGFEGGKNWEKNLDTYRSVPGDNDPARGNRHRGKRRPAFRREHAQSGIMRILLEDKDLALTHKQQEILKGFMDHGSAYAEEVANARMLLEDKALALSQEQQDMIKAMHSPYHVRFALAPLLSEDQSNLPCCNPDDFEKERKGNHPLHAYAIQSLLENKDLGLTQEQREILLEDQTREQDPRNMHDWSHWSPRPVQRCQMQGRACWKSLSRKELLVPAKPTSSAAQGSSDAKSDESPPQGNSDAKSDDLPGLDTSSGDTSSGNANGYDNHDHTHAETTTDDEKVAKKDVGMY